VNYRKFLIPAAGLLAVLIGFLVWGGLSDSLVYYLTPTEAVEQQADFPDGERLRLGGLVEAGTVSDTADGVSFAVSDGATSVQVIHTGTPPQLFQEDIGVVVEGAWTGDEFHSDLLLVRHDEQYRAPDGDGVYEVPPSAASGG
jgi:cytochrome c-type biogenesis protein CcmE